MLTIGIAGGTGSNRDNRRKENHGKPSEGEVVLLPQDSIIRQQPCAGGRTWGISISIIPMRTTGLCSLNRSKRWKRDISVEQPVYSYITCASEGRSTSNRAKWLSLKESSRSAIPTQSTDGSQGIRGCRFRRPPDSCHQRDVLERNRTAEAVMERYSCPETDALRSSSPANATRHHHSRRWQQCRGHQSAENVYREAPSPAEISKEHRSVFFCFPDPPVCKNRMEVFYLLSWRFSFSKFPVVELPAFILRFWGFFLFMNFQWSSSA